jgi:TrkA domain protein
MSVVNEIPLPGIGVRYEFVTQEGDRVAVVHHRSGLRELSCSNATTPIPRTTCSA